MGIWSNEMPAMGFSRFSLRSSNSRARISRLSSGLGWEKRV